MRRLERPKRCAHHIWPKDGNPQGERCLLPEGHAEDHDYSYQAERRMQAEARNFERDRRILEEDRGALRAYLETRIRRGLNRAQASAHGLPRDDGLDQAEGEVMDHIVDAVAAYRDLPPGHSTEAQEFRYLVHSLQHLLAARAMRRLYPEGWT